MKRRSLLQMAPALAVSASTPGALKVGCQSGGVLSDDRLAFFKRHGVLHICGQPAAPANGAHWTAAELKATRDMVEKHGITLAMIPLPFLASSHVDKTKRAAIVLGQSPDRDRDIDDIQRMIRACAEAGIPAIKYNMSILGVLRTESTPGRGGSRYSTWRLKEAGLPQLTRAGRVTADIFWERITYFLDRVIPVANEHRVRMACHPHDPGVPPEGFQGVDRVLGTVAGMKKFVKIQESPYHGLNFCQGTVSEMLKDPAREIFDVITFFGEARKIFNVHFRNIRGCRDNFQEKYIDEGDIDMLRAAEAYKKAGYDGMLMPDHVPHHPDDPQGKQAFAHAYGYIQAIIRSVSRG